MTKWKRLRRGSSAKHVTFCAQTVARLDRSNDRPEGIPRQLETAPTAREGRTLKLNSNDKYGCLTVRRDPRRQGVIGAFLNQDVVAGQALALIT